LNEYYGETYSEQDLQNTFIRPRHGSYTVYGTITAGNPVQHWKAADLGKWCVFAAIWVSTAKRTEQRSISTVEIWRQPNIWQIYTMETLNSAQPLYMREKIQALRNDYNQLNIIPVFQQPKCIKSVVGDALELIDDMAKRIEILETIAQLEIIPDQRT